MYKRHPGDPFEPANRDVWALNQGIDRAALRPAATIYHENTPTWVHNCVSNFFANLSSPRNVVHSLLQGKPGEAGQETLRFFRPRQPVYVVPNAVDVGRFRPAESGDLRAAVAAPGEFVLSHVSNFRPVKRVADVVRIFAGVAARVPASMADSMNLKIVMSFKSLAPTCFSKRRTRPFCRRNPNKHL